MGRHTPFPLPFIVIWLKAFSCNNLPIAQRNFSNLDPGPTYSLVFLVAREGCLKKCWASKTVKKYKNNLVKNVTKCRDER